MTEKMEWTRAPKEFVIEEDRIEITTEPKGQILIECGEMLRRGIPKIVNDKPVKDSNGKTVYKPYEIKVFNTIDFNKSMKYNPFAYIKSEKDILKMVNTLMENTKGDGPQSGDPFWDKAERLLYTAYMVSLPRNMIRSIIRR